MANVNNNVNGQSMVESKEAREARLAALENKLGNLRESKIWESTGGKFETVFGEYMTRKQVAAFFGVPETAIKTYSDSARADYKEELESAGVRKYSKKELDDMKISIAVSNGNRTNDNDMTDSYTPNNTGETLYPLRAVVKLGMFMTKTDSAKLFRDAIIDELQAGVAVKKAYQTAVQGYLQQMNLSAQNGDIFDSGILTKIMNDLRVTSQVCYKKDIISTIDELQNVSVTYNNLLRNVNMLDDPLYHSQIKSAIEQLTISVNVLQQTIIKLDGVRLDANTAKELYNRSDIIKDAVLQKRNESSKDYNARITQLTSLLQLAGYVSIEEDYQAPQRDAQGKKITLDLELCDSRSNVFVDIYGVEHAGSKVLKYVAGESGKEWIFNNEYVMNRDTKQQVLKYTPVGRSLWGALYRQADIVYDKLVKQCTDKKSGTVDNAKIRKIIEKGGTNLVSECRKAINLTKEEFEAQYAYAVLNNNANSIVLL